MHRYSFVLGLLAAAAASAPGCASAPKSPSAEELATATPPRTAPRWQQPPDAAATNSADNSAAAAPGSSLAGQSATAKAPAPLQAGANAATPSTAKNPSAAPTPSLQQVMAEIESLGDVSPEVQKRLLEDLRQSDPALWPLMTQQIRATLAYQKEQAAKAGAAPPAAQSQQLAAAPSAQTAKSPSDAQRQVAARGIVEPQTIHPQPYGQQPNEPAAPLARQATPGVAPAQPGAAPIPAAANQPSAIAAAGEVQVASFEQPTPEKTETKQPAAKAAVSQTPASDGDWGAPLAAAIAALESQTREPARDDESTARHAHLRMLYLAAGRRDDALRPIPGLPPAQQDYWSKQLFALSAYLDAENIADPSRRAAEAASHLSQAAASLGQLGPLVVKNLNFCTEVVSYGVFKRFEHNEFKPGQQVLLYAEVENFKSEESAEGFHTALQSSYQILDSQGRRVAHDDFALTEEHCQNRRRDYFIRYFLTLPAMIYEGRYTLELTIEDTLGRKIGQSTIEFSVQGKAK